MFFCPAFARIIIDITVTIKKKNLRTAGLEIETGLDNGGNERNLGN